MPEARFSANGAARRRPAMWRKYLKRRSLSDPSPSGAASSERDPAKSQEQRRLFVLDTNVLMHDPTAIFRFEEHDVFLPMVVLEELDAHKKGLSEQSRNV